MGDGVASAALLVTTDGLAVGIGDCVAGQAEIVMDAGLGVPVLEQATTASDRRKNEPTRARRLFLTLSSQSCVSQTHP